MSRIRTCLWYKTEAEEAAEFYTSIIPNSSIECVDRPGPGAPPVLVHFSLDGVPYSALNGGQEMPHSSAASIVVRTEDQAETDRLWQAILDHGGTEVQCGWITDRYGLSWQIVPRRLSELMFDADTAASQRVYAAMLKMVKLDVAALEAAYEGKEDNA